MKKIERLNWIILTLKQRGKMSASQLAQYMEVSPRTIYRDMTALSEIQVPLRVLDGADGGYEIDPDYFLPTIRLQDREILLLLALLKLSERLNLGDFSPDVRALGQKLLEVCQGDAPRLKKVLARITFDLDAILPDAYPPALFARIIEAFAEERQLQISYFTPLRGDLTERRVSPHELFFADGCWYLAAFCHARQQQRTFRLDRIRSVQVLEARAEMRDLAGDNPADDPLQEIVLEMEAPLYELIRSDAFVRGAHVKTLADGRKELRLWRRNLEPFHRLALRNIDEVWVKAPEALVASIRTTLAKGTQKYAPLP